jgi:hypothetical protein
MAPKGVPHLSISPFLLFFNLYNIVDDIYELKDNYWHTDYRQVQGIVVAPLNMEV